MSRDPSYEDLMALWNEISALDINAEYVFTNCEGATITLRRTQ